MNASNAVPVKQQAAVAAVLHLVYRVNAAAADQPVEIGFADHLVNPIRLPHHVNGTTTLAELSAAVLQQLLINMNKSCQLGGPRRDGTTSPPRMLPAKILSLYSSSIWLN